MSDAAEFVTREEMQAAIQALEDRIQKRTEAFVVEIRGLIGQLRDDRKDQFLGLIDSNRSMGESLAAFRLVIERADANDERRQAAASRTLDAWNRNAEATAARLMAVEKAMVGIEGAVGRLERMVRTGPGGTR